MKRESKIDFKVVFIIGIIIFSISMFIIVAQTLIDAQNRKNINENVEQEQLRVLTDAETQEVFSKYHKLYKESIDLIDEGIGGKISEKVYNKTKNLNNDIRNLNVKEKYKTEQDNLALAFDYLNKSMQAYNDYVYFQGNRRDKFDTSYKHCLDDYLNYLGKSQTYYGLIN